MNTPFKSDGDQAEAGAIASSSQGISSDSENSQKTLARCMPHTKEKVSQKELQEPLEPPLMQNLIYLRWIPRIDH